MKIHGFANYMKIIRYIAAVYIRMLLCCYAHDVLVILLNFFLYSNANATLVVLSEETN